MASTMFLLVASLVAIALAQKPKMSPEEIAEAQRAHERNDWVCKYTAWTWAAIIGTIFVYRWTKSLLKHVRQLANLNHGSSSDGGQKYFSVPDEHWARFKRYFLSAPLFRRRHNNEFRLSAAVNVGTLPGRLQTIFLIGYFIMNMALAGISIEWTRATFYNEARDRTGVLAVLNMIPLFLLAGRNNPLIYLLDISFDTYNLIHRWIGRIVVFEAIAHFSFYMAGKAYIASQTHSKQDIWAALGKSLANSSFILSGTIAGAAFTMLLLHSPSIIRHAFYETFLHVHFILVCCAVGGLWVHLAEFPTYRAFLITALVCWIVERSIRVYRIIRGNTGKFVSKAELEALPGDAVRVTLKLPRPWKFRPGQHVYLYMPSVGLWTSHPFSLAWSTDDAYDFTNEKLPTSNQDPLAKKNPTVSLVIRRRTGFTDAMWKKAEKSPGGKCITTAFVEGPYGSQSFKSYGTVMLFAAGIGITHQVPHVRDLVAAYANGTCATRKVILVWVIQSPEHLEWIRPWMTQILGMEKRREVLKILLFVTRPRSTKEIHSPSASVQMFPGKPDVGALMDKEQEKQVGAMAVSVCGTGSMSDDVRRAMRDRCERTEMDLYEEAFSW